ncbi:hypothetical protein AAGG74_19185 [Bacillus mexicanus]|uniref:hypothetical protein n=1 Tax=Bacillus mexicanus TaxID=2834415 RepID=UPI003D23A6D5
MNKKDRVGNQKEDTVIFVTTFEKLEKNEGDYYEFGSTRTVGVFKDIEEARDIVENNKNDINETIYNYAVIEEVDMGLYPTLKREPEFYKATNVMKAGVDGKEKHNSDLIYELIEAPENSQNDLPLAIG